MSCTCRCDGIGRRSGLKIHRWRQRTGSSPVTGTSSSQALYRLRRVFCLQKTHRSLTPLLLASKSNPLTLGSDLGETGASEKRIISVNIHRNNKIRTCSDGRQVRIFAFFAKWDLSLLTGLEYGVCLSKNTKGLKQNRVYKYFLCQLNKKFCSGKEKNRFVKCCGMMYIVENKGRWGGIGRIEFTVNSAERG